MPRYFFSATLPEFRLNYSSLSGQQGPSLTYRIVLPSTELFKLPQLVRENFRARLVLLPASHGREMKFFHGSIFHVTARGHDFEFIEVTLQLSDEDFQTCLKMMNMNIDLSGAHLDTEQDVQLGWVPEDTEQYYESIAVSAFSLGFGTTEEDRIGTEAQERLARWEAADACSARAKREARSNTLVTWICVLIILAAIINFASHWL